MKVQQIERRFSWLLKLGALMLLAVAVFAASDAAPTQADGPAISPDNVEVTIEPGGSTTITKTVTTPAFPPLLDVVFFADTTGSMGGSIANVQANVGSIMTTVLGSAPNAQFAAAEYKDGDPSSCPSDPYAYQRNIDLSSSQAAVQAAVNTWTVDGYGCDTPESQLYGLQQLSTGGAANQISFRAGSTRYVVWFGDASGHDPALGVTQAMAIAALMAPSVGGAGVVKVIAIPVAGGDGLDSTGQATGIVGGVGGQVMPGATPAQVSAAILAGLSNIPVDVAMRSNCVAPVITTFVPASRTVTSGSNAVFTETITLSAAAVPGTAYTCHDWATINGSPMTDASGATIFEEKIIHAAGAVGGVVSLLVSGPGSGSAFPTIPVAVGASVLVVLGAGLWYSRRRLLG